MIRERLRLFIRKNEVSPSKIIVYCAVISDGQYQQVLDKELPMIKKACKEVCKNSSDISIAITIVSRAHQKRFYPLRQARTDESSLIIAQPEKTAHQSTKETKTAARDQIIHPAGTIVDRDTSRATTLLRGWDFVLQAQAASNKGNAKSTQYVVMKDETVHSAKAIETMANKLCYMVGGSIPAVSVCAPINYAHLICKGGGVLLAGCANEKRMEKVTSMTNDKTIDKAACGVEAFETRGIHQRPQDTPFYTR